MTALQQAILLLAPQIWISLLEESEATIQLHFAGTQEVPKDEIINLIKANAISYGYRTGRIKVEQKPATEQPGRLDTEAQIETEKAIASIISDHKYSDETRPNKTECQALAKKIHQLVAPLLRPES